MPVNIPLFDEFFRAKKNGTYKCPVCAHENFVANIHTSAPVPPGTPPDRVNVALLSIPSQGDLYMPAVGTHSFYSITCTNCGHTDLFHKAQFDIWLAAGKPARNV